MPEQFLETHLRALYKLLKHEGYYSRMGALNVQTKEYQEELVFGEESVLAFARGYNGSRNVFIGRAARNWDRSIAHVAVASYDIDPLRPHGEASTDEQHSNAILAGRRICSMFNGGYLSSSGNGCLLLFALATPIDDLQVYYEKESTLIKEFQEKINDLGVKIDATSYDQAIIKAIGTLSTKGSKEYRRVSHFLDFPMLPYHSSNKLVAKVNSIVSPVVIKINSKFIGDPVKRLQDAQECLKKISKERCDVYEDWIKVGMALKEFGIAGLNLWKEWSKQSEKYEEGTCETKWSSFKESPDITLGTLRYWAKESNEEQSGIESPDTYFTNLFDREQDSQSDIRTGFSSLDSIIGPFPSGELVTFAARSGFGKTTFACTVAEKLRKANQRILYFSTEMHRTYIMHKLVAIACNIPLDRMVQRDFTEEERTRIRAYKQELLLSPINICDDFQPTLEKIKSQVQEHKPDLIIFDHINQAGTHYEEIAKYVRALKSYAKDNKLAVLMLAQLNEPPRAKDGGVVTSVRGDVRGTQEIIYLSAVFCMLSNLFDVKGDLQPVEVTVAKNRYGISNQTVQLRVSKSIGKFYDE